MKTKTIMFLILGTSMAGMCFAQFNPATSPIGTNNAVVNADKDIGVSTSMNGNSSSSAGVPISSTSSSSESRNTDGSGD